MLSSMVKRLVNDTLKSQNAPPSSVRIFDAMWKEGVEDECKNLFEDAWHHFFKNLSTGNYSAPELLFLKRVYHQEPLNGWVEKGIQPYNQCNPDAFPFLALLFPTSVSALRTSPLITRITVLNHFIRHHEPYHSTLPHCDDCEAVREELSLIKQFLETHDLQPLAEYYVRHDTRKGHTLLDKLSDHKLAIQKILADLSANKKEWGQREEYKSELGCLEMLESLLIVKESAQIIITEFEKKNGIPVPPQWLNRISFGLFEFLYQFFNNTYNFLSPTRAMTQQLKQQLIALAVKEVSTLMNTVVKTPEEAQRVLEALCRHVSAFASAHHLLQEKMQEMNLPLKPANTDAIFTEAKSLYFKYATHPQDHVSSITPDWALKLQQKLTKDYSARLTKKTP